MRTFHSSNIDAAFAKVARNDWSVYQSAFVFRESFASRLPSTASNRQESRVLWSSCDRAAEMRGPSEAKAVVSRTQSVISITTRPREALVLLPVCLARVTPATATAVIASRASLSFIGQSTEWLNPWYLLRGCCLPSHYYPFLLLFALRYINSLSHEV